MAGEDSAKREAAAQAAEQICDEAERRDPRFPVLLFAGAVLGKSIFWQAVVLIAVGLGLSLLSALIWARRRGWPLSLVFVPQAVSWLAVLCSMVFLLVLGSRVSALSLMLVALLMGASLTDALHITDECFRGFKSALMRDDALLSKSIGASLRHLANRCFLTSFTTSASLASLCLVQGPPGVFDLGWQGSLGVMVAWVLTMLWIPVFVSQSLRRGVTPRRGAPQAQGGGVDGIAHKPITWAAAFVCIPSLLLALGSRVDLTVYDPFMPWSDAHGVITSVINAIDTEYLGVIELKGPSGTVERGDVVAAIHRFRSALADEKTGVFVMRANSVDQWVESLQRHEHHPAEQPPVFTDATLRHFFATMAKWQIPFEELVDPSHSETVMALVTPLRQSTASTAQRAQEQILAIAQREFGGFEGLEFRLRGMMFYLIPGLVITKNLIASLVWFLPLMALCFWVMTSSVYATLVGLLVNIVPIVVMLALLRMVGGMINVTNVFMFAVVAGVIVDNTIHFLGERQHQLEAGLGRRESILRAHELTRSPIVGATAIFVAAFLPSSFSGLAPLFHMGFVGGLGLLVAGLCDYYLLPALLLWRAGGAEASTQLSSSQKESPP